MENNNKFATNHFVLAGSFGESLWASIPPPISLISCIIRSRTLSDSSPASAVVSPVVGTGSKTMVDE